jgi:predicted transcriptional regulator
VTSTRVAGVISIRPRHARRIFDGSKTAEFRRARMRLRAPAWLAVYECQPVGGITGAVMVESVTHADRAELLRFESDPDERRLIGAYLEGAAVGTALHIGQVRRFARIVPLSAVGVVRPPQSYLFIDAEIA